MLQFLVNTAFLKQILLGWMREKSKIYDAVEKKANSKRKQRMRAQNQMISTGHAISGSLVPVTQ